MQPSFLFNTRLFFWHEHPLNTQRHAIYSDSKHIKAANPHVCDAQTSEFWALFHLTHNLKVLFVRKFDI